MTDPLPQGVDPIQSAPARSGAGRGFKIAFAISVALNLAVAGLVAGAWIRDGGPGGFGRDLSLGPFSEALSREDRRAIREEILANREAFAEGRRAAKAEFDTLLAALRADPFDPGAVDAALGAIVARNAGRLDKAKDLLEARIVDMAPEDRLAFADRLEGALQHGPRD